MDLITLAMAMQNGGGGEQPDINVDSAISSTSANPVENRVIAAALNLKADKTEITDFVTADNVDDAITDAIGDVVRFEYYLCEQGEYDPQTEEPTVQKPDVNHIYLVPTSGENLLMYAYIAPDFVFLGTTEIDMSGYPTEADLQSALANFYTKTQVDNKLAQKADETDLAGYYTKTQVDNKLAQKADETHNHDSRYYTKTDVDTKLNGKSNTGHTHAYSELTGKPTIPTVPSNITLGKKGGTNTQLIINVIDSGTPASGTPDTTITIVKG